MTEKAKIIVRILIVNVIAWGTIGGVLFLLYWSTYHVTPPKPPSDEELLAIESRFAEMRPLLESVVAFESRAEWKRLRAVRDSLVRNQDFDGLAAIQKDFDEHDRQVARLLRGVRPTPSRVDASSDSLIYVPMLSRRGRGASAPWVHAGLVFAREWPANATKRLDGHWFVYSDVSELAWLRGGPD